MQATKLITNRVLVYSHCVPLNTLRQHSHAVSRTTYNFKIQERRACSIAIFESKLGLLYHATRNKTYFSSMKQTHCPLRTPGQKNMLLTGPNDFLVRFHVRHFSEQTVGVNTGLWTRVFLWMSESTPVSYAQDLLLTVHSSTGLPWWGTIMVTTVFLRTIVTLPLAMYQNYILAKVENLQHLEMPEIVKELKKETAIAMKQFNWSERQARIVYNRSLKKQWNSLIIRDNCHPFKASILLWIQIPMWIFLSVSLRNLVYMLPHQDGAAMMTYMELSVGGFGWIPNLLVPDESLVLPVALGLINLAIIELQTMSKIRKDSKLQKYVTHLFRGLSLVMIPIAASVPSCLSLYWVTSSTYGLIQNLILLSPRVKRFGNIPETPSELEKPYKHIASEIRQRAARIPTWWKPEAKH